jgi:acyl carrier protein
VHDNFFLLGGSSFLGIQVIARVREKFGVEVPLRALFEAPTIADLSAQIAQLRASDNISA